MKTILTLAALTLASCGERILRGSGPETTDSRALSAFKALDLQGSENVEIIAASTPRVEIIGYKNLVESYEATVTGNTLRLGYKDNVGNIRNNNIRIRLYTPGVERIELSGSSNVSVAAGATIPVRTISIAGSGDVTLRQSEVPQLDIEIAGSGAVHAREAKATHVNLDIAGSGDIEVTATELVKADIAGSGDVHIWGGARVEKDIAGSGDIVQH